MHDHGHQVCSKLAPGLWCFQISKCADGGFQDVLHQHVPPHRLAQESARSEWPGFRGKSGCLDVGVGG